MYNSEEEFLKNYNSNEFEKLSLTTDIIIFSVSNEESNNYRKLSKKHFSVLLVKRNTYPFKDKWCLPGGFVKTDESIDDAAIRILADETNLNNIYMEQLFTFGKVDRDPRMRIVSTAYMSLIDKSVLKEKILKNASWFNMEIFENETEISLILDNNIEVIKVVARKKLIEKTTGKYIYEILENKSLAFDHAEVILAGINRLKNKVEYTDIVFNMMPEYFTLGDLQKVYEIILGKKLLDPAFRRIISNKVEKTKKMSTGKGHRPSVLFRYKNDKKN